MPRPISKELPRWKSKKHAHGYVKPGRGSDPTAMLFHKSKSALTEPALRWEKENKELAVAQLDAWIDAGCPSRRRQKEIVEVTDDRPTTLFALVRLFRTFRFPDIPASVIQTIEQALKIYTATDCPLTVGALTMHLERVDAQIKKRGSISNLTRSSYLSQMKRIFRFAVDCGWLPNNPVAVKGLPRIKKRVDNPTYTPSEMQAIIDNRMKVAPHVGRWIQFVYLTAMRPGETLKIMLSDITTDAIRVTGKGSRTSNGPRIRNIPISTVPGLRELVDVLVESAQAARSNRLFFSWTGTRPLAVAFNTARKETKVPTFVTLNGVPVKRTMYNVRASGEWVMENVWGWDGQEIEDYTGHDYRIRKKHYRGIPEAGDLAARITKKARPIKTPAPTKVREAA